jgi:serine/threonine protein kinase
MLALIGRKLGDYMIVESLGQGGMAHVYKGYDANLDRYAAVKVISQNTVAGDDEQEYRERFQREARSIARLSHPHIVSIYQFGQTEDQLYYMAMKMIDGQDLRQILKDHLKRGTRLTTKFVLKVMRDITGALDYAHAQGVIHRDVKPSNIMMTRDNDAILTDFGLALSANEGTLGNTFGSVHYIAPEQAVSSRQATPQSDLYSLGVVLYELLTGKVPFDDSSAMSVALKHISDPPPPPSQINPDISPQVEEVLMKMLDKDPRRRYETGAAFMKALEVAFTISPNQDTEEMEDKAPQSPPIPSTQVLEARQNGTVKPITERPIKTRNVQVPTLQDIQEAETIRDSSQSSKLRDSILKAQSRTRMLVREQRIKTAVLMGIAVLGLFLTGFALAAAIINQESPAVTPTVVAIVADEASPTHTETVTLTLTPTLTETAIPTDTAQPTATHTASATRTATLTRTATVTQTATATLTVTPSPSATPTPPPPTPALNAVDDEAPIVLRYDGRSMIILNRHEDERVDVSNLDFVFGGEGMFNSDRWGTGNDNLYALRPGDCFQVWTPDIISMENDEFPADACRYRQGFLQIDEVFWVSSVADTTFKVQLNGRTLAECPAVDRESNDDTRCVFDVP